MAFPDSSEHLHPEDRREHPGMEQLYARLTGTASHERIKGAGGPMALREVVGFAVGFSGPNCPKGK